jgi:hypothetical protein
MNPRVIGLLTIAATLVLSAAILAQTPMDATFTYQGLIKQSGIPVNGTCDFRITLYDAASGGSQIGTTQANAGVAVSNGLFTVELNFGPAFQGNKSWLDIQARCPSSSGSFVMLSPRQALTATPYALGLPGLHTEMNPESPNIIGGFKGNGVDPGVVGAVVAGGGKGTGCGSAPSTDPCPNRVIKDYGTVGGGAKNQAGSNLGSMSFATVGGGWYNTASSVATTVGGGQINTASGSNATVSGGSENTASGSEATVGGGIQNTASGDGATVGGGEVNIASGSDATVGGGVYNKPSGDYATVGGGWGNTASGDSATVPGGVNAVASHYGEMAYAAGSFSYPPLGDAQTSLYVLRNTTSNSTKTYLFLNGQSGSSRITVAAKRALIFEIQVIGISDTGVTGGYRIRGVLKNIGGTTSMVGATGDVPGEDPAAVLWDAVAEADDVNDALVVAVTGSNGVNIRWVASVRTTEVAW